MRATLRPLLAGSAVLFLLASACADPPQGTAPDAELSPVDDIDCTGQEAETSAGDDADTTVESDGCTQTTASDSGDGDFAFVSVSDLGDGLFAIELESVETGGDDADPTAHVEVEFTVRFEAGGEWLVFSAFDASTGAPAVVVGECASGAATVPIVFRGSVPTSPQGGSVTCTVTATTPGAGSYRVLAGADLAPDGDGDGVSDRNDRCPGAPGPGDPSGCEESGSFGSWAYYCSDRDACFCDVFPGPCFCRDCSVESEDVRASVAGEAPGNDITLGSDDTLRCNGCLLEGKPLVWNGFCDFCSYEIHGRAVCDETEPLGSPDACAFRIGTTRLDDPLVDEQIVVDRDALASPAPLAVRVDKVMSESSGDGVFSFTLATAGRTYQAEIATAGGAGTTTLVLAFEGEASITENATPGFALVGHDCPGEGATATLTESRHCRFVNEQTATAGVIPIGVTGAETISPLPDAFGPVTGSHFAVNGDNGFVVFGGTLGLVTSLTRLGGFRFTNVLGSLWIDDPDSPDDWLGGWNQGAGSFQTPWLVGLNDFAATQIGFGAIYDGVHRDGDPNADTAVQVTSDGVRRLFLEDSGAGTNALSSATYVATLALPSNFAAASAFLTTGSDEVLIAARSTTAGQPGRAFRADPTTGFGAAIESGDLGVDPRLLRCASAGPPTQVCLATPFGSAAADVLLWTPGAGAAVVDSIETGAAPLGLAVFAAGAEIRAAITNFEDDSLTLARLDGTTGALLASGTQALQPGCTEPSSVLPRADGSLLVLCNGATAGQSALSLEFPQLEAWQP